MEQYIPKSALLAEIERLVNNYNKALDYDKALDYEAALEDVRNFLDSLEMKEINFENIKSIFNGQYLSKDKVVTTIERLQDECEEQGDNNGVELLEKLFNKLDTIVVKEMDLEKEISEYFVEHSDDFFSDKYKLIAKHFYEL